MHMRRKEQHLPKTYTSNKLNKKKHNNKKTKHELNYHKLGWPVYAYNVAKHIR